MRGNITTEMFQTYAHLTGQNIDAEMLRVYGINSRIQHRKRDGSNLCNASSALSSIPRSSKHYSNCGMRLTDDVIASDTMMQEKVCLTIPILCMRISMLSLIRNLRKEKMCKSLFLTDLGLD